MTTKGTASSEDANLNQEMQYNSRVSEIAVAVAEHMAQMRRPRQAWERYLMTAVTIVSILSLAFTVGLNWGKVPAMEERLQKLEDKESARDFSLSQVVTNQAVTQTQMRNIEIILAEIKGRMDRTTTR